LDAKLIIFLAVLIYGEELLLLEIKVELSVSWQSEKQIQSY